MLVQAADGWKVWGTLPAGLLPSSWNTIELNAALRALKGQSVTMTAAVAPSPSDALFGFFKRPVVKDGPTAPAV